MPQILVWQCPSTKKLFEDQDEYKKHLAKLARERRKVKHHNYIKSTFLDWLDNERTNKVLNVDDIPQWLLDNQQTIMDGANLIPCGNWADDKFHDTDNITRIVMPLRWNSNVSNSHSCPKGGVQNWGGRQLNADGTPRPNGYPGWSGRVDGSMKRLKKHMNNYPISGFFKLVGIHTGTGGGGNDNFGWDVKLFASEWPAAASSITFAKLVGQV